MEESHFNSSYFWSPVPTVSGQLENTMFINKMKDQLIPDKVCNLPPPHYPTLLTVPGSVPVPAGLTIESDSKSDQLAPHSQATVTQNITVVPVPTTGLMTAGLVITSPPCTLVTTASSAQTFPVSAPPAMIVSAVPGSQALQVVPEVGKKLSEEEQQHVTNVTVATMKPPGQRGRKKKRMVDPTLAELADPYELSTGDDDEGHKDGKSYRCRMCSITFYSKSEMQLHAKSHTETKPHKCPHCSKTFANSSYLAQHIRIHSGAKPYTCNYCQKSFRQLSHLQQHTRIHTGDRPYKCAHPGCEKAFTQLSNLQSHRRQHNKDKPFKCHNCHRAYTDASSLEVHLSTHTVKHAKVYTCSICSRAYTSETYLMKHMRKHNVPEQQQQQLPGNLYSSAGAQQQQQPTESPQCSFEHLNPFKADPHKDICLTVSTSAIQVEHLGNS
ncbi:zinc finger protein 384 [Latimeria chalumnae]|uniref:Zinc finger protein 384 n=1 Tax=Latimeria chalumnae TaxID=7897 RepID=H3APF6_LATCH|nr:PREDICTED: zinc finger protein 384 [Latimeria chalumnae]XP_014350372.1 PREDICTED: zinc finger protein 384 [Latimeria chalumnae]XP_014350373.1 PREDICTED: zinc finger protein 384 [Latimeria chalumnae]XP_014350374.1 PREDICTED: zinc finger protein 384 [Latimeria chalumnae]|eukprot:XP_006006544.1 PREDICTED: zinc finger protein 384 [Latimeria chalumnae]